MEEAFSIIVEEKAFDQVYVILAGRVSMDNAERVRSELIDVVKSESLRDVVVDLKNLSYLDSSGVAILLELSRMSRELGNTLRLTNIPLRIQSFLELMEFQHPAGAGILSPRPEPSIIEQIGSGALRVKQNARDIVTFIGATATALFQYLSRPSKLKWDDLWKLIEKSGADAIPIVTILSFLMGGVLAFQAAIQLRKFGANIFVADLVSLSICLEMGPLMTAVIVSGRSGAAYAAHIGTMQVNEEIDALRIMAIDPVRYLVVPRILAVAFALPCLTLFADLVGILGGCVVSVSSLDLTPTAYFEQVRKVLEVSDVVKGLVKSFAFGIEIAMVGCLRGFQVRGGAESVGVATTSAVVTCIFLLTVTDAVFSMLYYYLPSIGI
ncbi:MAG: MlaE family lipid ABC transporter permease subunit [Desulfomonile tiedjei]|uniref:MlaE family lipid ABC transporter permease subunit n=1 Tax=Desulfomonile tiedjei TaxID=2358 RepID=A0A9D6V235_9BACT|nr:MlaE family lipid ABC transporter permease subunit [Desulfomonile tiedjei]